MEPLQQAVEEAAYHEGMDADAERAIFATRLHSCGLDRMIKNAHRVLDLIDEMASSFRQADAARIAIEQDDAEISFQHSNSGTHARLTDAKRVCGTGEA
ncbi:hypothetical protein GCM10007276_35220 [Agaricicola taiwanensis]|uniref:Uncharacterized protein n=1 Tax=Agaricicola taiwanensis TaxID=591372 RepID=A0A8J2YNH0_9RHOB|nr:hypothetical protein GCM10007276_35220 [Agaricicola taiwanensis]